MTANGDGAAEREKISEIPVCRLGETVERERARHFVGREAELALFERMLSASPPVRVLLLHGAGGMGKSALLDALQRRARDLDFGAIQIDAGDLTGGREAVERAIRGAIDTAEGAPGDLAVLLIDNFEALAQLETWFREHLLADLPGRFRVVLAMRQQPASQWQLDAGWSRLARVHRLEGLEPEAAESLLDRLGVPLPARAGIHALAGGHPLALTLAAQLGHEVASGQPALADSPQLVRELSERHLVHAPSEAARDALFACALTRRLSRPLLAAMLGNDDVEELFEWLRRQSFARETLPGLISHDLVGEALCARLEHRHPDHHRRLIRRGMRHLLDRAGEIGESAISDVLYLMRGLPAVRRIFVIGRDTGWHVDRLRDGDSPVLADLTERQWGREARHWFETWVAAAPDWLAVLRNADHRPLGMSFYLDLEALDAETASRDPAVGAFRDHVEGHAPLRRGERAMLARFLLAGDESGPLPAGVAQLQCRNAFMPVSVEGLALTGSVRPDNEPNRTQARYSGIRALPGTEFSQDGQPFFIMGHDWRVAPFAEWIDGVMGRLVSLGEPAGRGDDAAVMTREDFEDAVRDALSAMSRRRSLDRVELARSPMVQRISGADTRQSPGDVLHALFKREIQALSEHRRGRDLVAVLTHTYLEPAPKQRAAAHEAGLAYGTYRRRLREAVAVLTERLWNLERAASDPDAN
ncbi:MAG: AAA family ATPase [Gammaproteobacteria bacterium]|nr:AAA family ATPase [Gammaproteobacteria bacterium]